MFETFDVFDHTPDAQALAISGGMQRAWQGLAWAPNVAPPFLPQGVSNWPAFDGANIQIVEFGDTIASVAAIAQVNARCWEVLWRSNLRPFDRSAHGMPTCDTMSGRRYWPDGQRAKLNLGGTG